MKYESGNMKKEIFTAKSAKSAKEKKEDKG
jgi:hypothetical protein